jgi:hypothetical protein
MVVGSMYLILAISMTATMVVAPFSRYEVCLDKRSIHRDGAGLTYFRTFACGSNGQTAVEEYRLSCRQDPDGPFAYERKVDDGWVALTAQSSDEIGQIIRRACKLPKRIPRKPAEPRF